MISMLRTNARCRCHLPGTRQPTDSHSPERGTLPRSVCGGGSRAARRTSCASARILGPIYGESASGVTSSTRRPSRCSSSSAKPTNRSNVLAPGRNWTRMSTSLSGRARSCRTEPNRARRCTPNARISASLAAKRSMASSRVRVLASMAPNLLVGQRRCHDQRQGQGPAFRSREWLSAGLDCPAGRTLIGIGRLLRMPDCPVETKCATNSMHYAARDATFPAQSATDLEGLYHGAEHVI